MRSPKKTATALESPHVPVSAAAAKGDRAVGGLTSERTA